MSSLYPTAYDLSLPAPVDDVTEVLADQGNDWSDAIYNLEHAVGLSGDTHSSLGTIYARVGALEDAGGGIFKQTSAPSSPATNDLWIDTSDADRPLRIFYSAAWHLIGADALTLRDLAIDTTAPTDGQVLTWVNADSKLEWITPGPSMTNPLTTTGDIIYSSSGTTPARLAIGSAGQFLGISGGIPAWQTPGYIPAPGSPAQGDVLYYNGSAWTRLSPGTSGQFLKTFGPSANPAWAYTPSSAPGDGIADPGGETQGSVLYYNGTDWAQLSPGTSGQFLKTNGASANPAWATPTSGLVNPMTTLSDIIIGDTGGAPMRLGIGSNGQALIVVSGAPAWTTWNPMTTQDDLIVGGSSGAATRLAKGSDNQVLTIDGSTHHVAWKNNSSGFADPTTTRGDLIYHGATGTTRLGLGSSGYVLTSDGTDAAWTALPTDTDYYQTLVVDSTTATQRGKLKLISGTNVTLSFNDNSGSGQSEVTIAAAGSGAIDYATPAWIGTD